MEGVARHRPVGRPSCSRRPLKGAQPVVRVTTHHRCHLKAAAAANHLAVALHYATVAAGLQFEEESPSSWE